MFSLLALSSLGFKADFDVFSGTLCWLVKLYFLPDSISLNLHKGFRGLLPIFLFAVFCGLFVCDTCTSAFKVEMAVLCFSAVLFGDKSKLLTRTLRLLCCCRVHVCKRKPNHAGGFSMCNCVYRKTAMSYDKNTGRSYWK